MDDKLWIHYNNGNRKKSRNKRNKPLLALAKFSSKDVDTVYVMKSEGNTQLWAYFGEPNDWFKQVLLTIKLSEAVVEGKFPFEIS